MVADPGKIRWAVARRLESQGLSMVFQRFTLGGKMLSPADLGEIPPPEGPASERDGSAGLVLSGKGPLWLYAHLVGLARSQGWPWVAVYDTRYCGGVVVSRAGAVDAMPELGEIVLCQPFPDLEVDEPGDDPLPDVPATTIHLTWTEGPRGTWTLRLAAPGSGRGFHPGLLGRPEGWFPFLEGMVTVPEVLVLSGPFPVWMISALAVDLAARHPDSALAVYNPSLPGSVVIHPGAGGRLPLGLVIPDVKPEVPVPAIALIGDPNSGKSVLSWKLYWALQRRGLEVYRLDCDASAPTTGWSQAGTVGQELRRRYKQERGDWTPGDETALAAAIAHLRESRLDLVLLDMPGGIHKNVPRPIRIPAGREELFRPVHGFILLARDETAFTGWTEALGAWNLESRILAIVEPSAGTSEAEIIPDGDDEDLAFRRWRIHGLDRSLYELSTPGLESLAEWLVGRLRLGSTRFHTNPTVSGN